VVGLPADVTSDQYPGRVFHGKIARSAMSIDPQTRTLRTEVDIDNPDLALVPGMYVQVDFKLSQSGLQEVPAAAILFRPEGLAVAVVGADNKVDFRPIVVAKDNGDVVVLAKGVHPGDRVVLNISTAITQGEEVVPQVDASNDVWPTPPEEPAPTEGPSLPANGTSPAKYLPVPNSGIHPPAPAKPPVVNPAAH
jgi:multidrug efflux pump subunit AcrA (membrane-fusion protein)